MYKIILIFFFIFLKAESIDSYNVKVTVLEDGKLDIIENILYDFTPNQRHGIFRYIPINRNIINLIDISMDKEYVNYEVFYENNNIVFKIGSADTLISGKHLYTIHYTIDKTVFNKNDTQNAISLNVIGTGWKVEINNIKIDIFLPQKLQNAKLQFFSGKKGSVTHNLIIKKLSFLHYQIFKDKLLPHQGITFDVIFDKKLIEVKTLSFGWVYIYAILLIIGAYLYYQKHKIPYIATSPQYYPPKDLDVLKVGILIDQIADEKDISTAILDLATRGYLKIETIKETTFKIFSTEVIQLVKLKESDGLDIDEKMLFDAIFYDSDRFILNQKNVQTASRLRRTIDKIDSWLYGWGVRHKYFNDNPNKIKTLFLLKFVALAMPFILYAFYESYQFYGPLVFSQIVVTIFFVIGLVFIILSKDIKTKLFGVLFSFVAGFIFFSGVLSISTVSISLLPFVVITYFASKVSAYTPKGIKILKYLIGLKEFILKVEKSKIEFLLQENPNYLDEMLPYAVLFGANHWFNFYNEFNISPSWYYGESEYFYSLDRELYNEFHNTSNYTEETSSDSFSGGGSVGSGSGGGGGGSW